MNDMNDIWRTIPGWEDYEINRDGSVRRTSSGLILQPSAAGQVRLARSRCQRSWRNVKRMLYQVFPEFRPVKPAPMQKQIVLPMPMEGEEFREYGDAYLVSNCGRVWSKAKCKMVRVVDDGNGHHQVGARRLMELVFGYTIPTEPGEEWRDHHSYPGHAFSSLGRVYSYYQRLIVSDNTSDKYRRLRWRGRKIRVHRVIAELFVPNPDNLPQVDHINENRYDNRAANLRWCTAEQNNEYYANNHYNKQKGEGRVMDEAT